MFTINDIVPLVKVPGAIAVVVKMDDKMAAAMDKDMREAIAKQIKKATKMPVFFVAKGVELETTTHEPE